MPGLGVHTDKIIIILYDKAIAYLNQAIRELDADNLPAAGVNVKNAQDIVADTQAPEYGWFLGQITDAQFGPLVHWRIGNVLIIDEDAALVAWNQPHHHVKQGRLAGTVGAQEANYFTTANVQTTVADNLAALELLGQAAGLQGVVAGPAQRQADLSRIGAFFSHGVSEPGFFFGLTLILTRPSPPALSIWVSRL